MTSSIYHCEQCGELLTTPDERLDMLCEACMFDREWEKWRNLSQWTVTWEPDESARQQAEAERQQRQQQKGA